MNTVTAAPNGEARAPVRPGLAFEAASAEPSERQQTPRLATGLTVRRATSTESRLFPQNPTLFTPSPGAPQDTMIVSRIRIPVEPRKPYDS